VATINHLAKRDIAELTTFVQSGGKKIYKDHSTCRQAAGCLGKNKINQIS
jgi:hypothetical protein